MRRTLAQLLSAGYRRTSDSDVQLQIFEKPAPIVRLTPKSYVQDDPDIIVWDSSTNEIYDLNKRLRASDPEILLEIFSNRLNRLRPRNRLR